MRIRHDGVHVTTVDGTTVVLDTGTSTYLTLSRSGAFLFGLLRAADMDLEALADALATEYGIGAVQARQDSAGFVDALTQQGLLAS